MATMYEKIISARLDPAESTPDTAFVRVDAVMTHDVGTAGVAPLLREHGIRKLCPEVRLITILDHFVPACNAAQARSHQLTREFVQEWQVKDFYEIGRGGICHQVMLENGHARAGGLVAATDAHVTTYGGAGCLGLGVGVTDAAVALSTGRMWLRRPRLIGVELTGKLRKPAAAKDLAILLLTRFPFETLNYSVLEFYGEGVTELSMDERFCLCNMLSEGGIKSCLVSCDGRTEAYMKAHAREPYELLKPDSAKDYDLTEKIELSEIVPMAACPHHPTNGCPVSSLEKIAIQQAFLGSCTNGRLEDLRTAAEILKGRKVHPAVRMVVTPGSQRIYLEAMREGLLEIFLEAGAMVTHSSCGACIGASSLLAPGEVCVSTSNRNFRGRMGSVDAEIYLASPATVAHSAIAGYITAEEEDS